MEVGLIHGHKSLAYLMFGIALINVVLALKPNKSVKALKILHTALMNIGRAVWVKDFEKVCKWVRVLAGPNTVLHS